MMKKRSKKAIALIGCLFLAASSAKAESAYDPNSFWFGFFTGGGATVCELARGGFISKQIAVEYMQGMLEGIEKDSDLIEFKKDVIKAYDSLKQDCGDLFIKEPVTRAAI